MAFFGFGLHQQVTFEHVLFSEPERSVLQRNTAFLKKEFKTHLQVFVGHYTKCQECQADRNAIS